jgi:hypothetical protein
MIMIEAGNAPGTQMPIFKMFNQQLHLQSTTKKGAERVLVDLILNPRKQTWPNGRRNRIVVIKGISESK